MPEFINPVGRKVATPGGSMVVCVELVNWAGVSLMLHKSIAAHAEETATAYCCSHERTGFAIARGPSLDTALVAGLTKLRPNLAKFHDQAAKLPTLNP